MYLNWRFFQMSEDDYEEESEEDEDWEEQD